MNVQDGRSHSPPSHPMGVEPPASLPEFFSDVHRVLTHRAAQEVDGFPLYQHLPVVGETGGESEGQAERPTHLGGLQGPGDKQGTWPHWKRNCSEEPPLCMMEGPRPSPGGRCPSSPSPIRPHTCRQYAFLVQGKTYRMCVCMCPSLQSDTLLLVLGCLRLHTCIHVANS